jgi:hypothetical protein
MSGKFFGAEREQTIGLHRWSIDRGPATLLEFGPSDPIVLKPIADNGYRFAAEIPDLVTFPAVFREFVVGRAEWHQMHAFHW